MQIYLYTLIMLSYCRIYFKGTPNTVRGSGKYILEYINRPCWSQAFDHINVRDQVRNPALQKVERIPYTGPVVHIPK